MLNFLWWASVTVGLLLFTAIFLLVITGVCDAVNAEYRHIKNPAWRFVKALQAVCVFCLKIAVSIFIFISLANAVKFLAGII